MKTNTTSSKYVARAVPVFASVSAFIVACAFAPLLPISLGMLAALGGVAALTSIEYVCSHFYRTKLDYYFEQSGMSNKTGQLPEVVGVEQTDSGTRYEIKFPAGLSVADVERERPAIEQFIGESIIVSQMGAQGFINCVNRRLRSEYAYEFIHTERPLEIVVGYGFSGPVATDIETWPHGLLAGETGGGKSTLLKGMIASLILKGGVELFLADFQRVELGPFRASAAVKEFAGTPQEFRGMLERLKLEHNRRLDLFYRAGVGSISAYNHKYPKRALPYRVVIIDEFSELAREKEIHAELMLRAAEDRKVGQHLIISTQRPSATVITGDTRANFPTMIALKVKDRDNSRIILDEPGADRLRGRGHALLKHAGQLTEFQAFNIDTEQAVAMVRHTFEQKERTPHAQPKQATRPPDRPIY